MNELIKVTQNENGEQLVSGRELHEFLEIKTQYSKWFDRMCEYGFTENVDYVPISQKRLTAQGNETTYTDYAINISMAKELSMIQRTEKGKQARLYFIECENKLKEISQKTQQQRLYERSPQELLSDNAIALNKMFESLKLNIPKEIIVSSAIEGTRNAIGYDFPEVRKLLNKQDEESYHTASSLLMSLNIKRNRTNEVLILLGLQSKGSSTVQPYILTELGKQYGVERTYTKGNHQGYQILWRDCLVRYVREHINEVPKEFLK